VDVRKTVVYFGIAALLCASGAGGRRTCVIVNEREACVDRAAHPHRPLLVFLHAYGSSGHDDQLMLAALAKSHDISYAAPDALPNESGNREWNDADIAFVSALIRSLVLATNADAMRVYLVGYSLGGFLALEFGCIRPEQVRAVVSVSGTRFEPMQECVRGAVSVLEIHGENDTAVLPGGGIGKRTGRPYVAAIRAVQFAARAAGCEGGLVAASETGGVDVVVRQAIHCPEGITVEQWMLRNAGHIPARPQRLASAIWRFLRTIHTARASRRPFERRNNWLPDARR